MPSDHRCEYCGTPLSGGFCPRCLLDAGISAEPNAGQDPSEVTVPLARLGDYELLQEIGRGGMGIVYRARQVSLDRIVAIKLLLFGGLAGTNAALRLRAEAVAAGSLRHPNIVTIHEVGLQDGQHFIAMDWIEGPSLADVLRDGPLSPRRAAILVRQVALAVQHAHERKIIHRDLKPSNILLDATDQPHVTDFGLAKNLGADTQLTLSGQTLGSPNYIPPEQIRGDHTKAREGNPIPNANNEEEQNVDGAAAASRKVSFASDVYALGAILYHALVGRAPFVGDDVAAVLHQVVEDEPLPPRRLNPSIAADLETICLKCLAKEPGKRFTTAQGLADDLGRFLNDEPIWARPVTQAERMWRWCRRNPVLASFASATLMLLLVVAIGGPIAAFRINRERRLAELRNYTADMNLVLQAWEEGNVRRAQALLNAHIPSKGQPDLRGFEWRYLYRLCQDESRLSFTNSSWDIHMALAEDGGFIVVGSGRDIKVRDYKGPGRELLTLTIPSDASDITALALSPADTNLLATASGSQVCLWNLSRKEITASLTLSNPAVALAVSPDGNYLAAAGGDEQTLELWQIAHGSLKWVRTNATPVRAVTFTPDGQSLVSGGGESCDPVLWDLATGASSPFPLGHVAIIDALVFSPDRKILAVGSANAAVVLWDWPNSKETGRVISSTANSVNALAFSPDSCCLITANDDSTIRRWDLATRQQVAIYRGHQEGVTGLAVSPDGRSILSCGADKTFKVWDYQPHYSGDEILTTNRNWTRTTSFSPDGQRLVSIDLSQGKLSVWDVATRSNISVLKEFTDNSDCIAFYSPNGEVLACSLQYHNSQSLIRILDARTLALRMELTNSFVSMSVAFSPDGQILAVSGQPPFHHLVSITNPLVFWDLQTKRNINKLAAAAPQAVMTSFSHDGKKVAIGYLDGTVRLWDYQSERLLARFDQQKQRIWAVAFSPDDAWLAAGGEAGQILFHDLHSQATFSPIGRSHVWVLGLCFTPDGKTLASAEGDGTIKLWNVATRELVLTLKGHEGPVSMDICFSPDGNLLASAGADGTVRLWPALPFDKIPAPGLRK